MTADLWDAVVGQDDAVRVLTAAARSPGHAYLLTGPTGCTKEAAARSFAALVVGTGGDADERSSRLVLAGAHPDVEEVVREGAAINAKQAEHVVERASRAPVEGARKVLILHEFHLLAAEAAARLLKTIEEPPESTVFIVLADQLTPALTTIASRCLRVPFRALGDHDIAEALVREGVTEDRAALVAAAARGDMTRARLLATDDDLEARRASFAQVPRRLDGTGHTVALLVDELLAAIDASMSPLVAHQAAEIAELEERVATLGERGSGRKLLDERHKREQRRYRTDEIRAGLTALASTYRDHLVLDTGTRRPDAFVHAVDEIHEAMRRLDRNVVESLLLQALLLRLPSI
jgi:DNA polymerase III subunit delta'